jgi:hypothetical protein
MKLFILPGNSPQNKEWEEKLKENLAEKINEIYNYKFITIPGNDHSYDDFSLISNYIFQFFEVTSN